MAFETLKEVVAIVIVIATALPSLLLMVPKAIVRIAAVKHLAKEDAGPSSL